MDHQVQKLISARGKSAVNKLELIEFRRRHPLIPIFVFEGIDDVIVYSSWVARLQNGLAYEPFPVNGKGQVLGLKLSLDQDLNQASMNVFYFVDRDFDDLHGQSKDDSVFMTDRYSVENYLIDISVVEQVLASELCCAKYPEVRAVLLNHYVQVLSAFITIMSVINFRIYLARKCNIRIHPAIPDKIGHVALVSLNKVEKGTSSSEGFIHLAREPTPEEIEQEKQPFSILDAGMRHRGKFLMSFMMKWFHCVDEEWNRPASGIFGGVSRSSGTRLHDIVLGSLAARSPVPVGLHEFLTGVPRVGSPLPDG